MCLCALHDIDPGRLQTAVAQYIRQLREILFQPVKGPGKQVPQIVGEHLAFLHPRFLTERFHLPPDVGTVQRLSAPGAEQTALPDLFLPHPLLQAAAQRMGQQDRPQLSLAANAGTALKYSLNGNIGQFGYPDTGGTDGLHHQKQAAALSAAGSGEQTEIFLPGEFKTGVPKDAALLTQRADAAVRPAKRDKKAIDSSQHGIDAGDTVTPP